MPCDSVIRNQVDLKVADRELLKAGLQNAGWQVTQRGNILYVVSPIGTAVEIHPDKAVIVSRGRSVDRNYQATVVEAIKVAYSSEVVRQLGESFGFNVETVVGQEFGGETDPEFDLVRESM